MPEAFPLTLVLIALLLLLTAFFRGRSRDKCLKDFAGYPVTVERIGAEPIYGRLIVEPTGFELVYAERRADADGHTEASFILYKQEYGEIWAIARYHDELDGALKEKREKALRKTDHPSIVRRTGRKLRNFANTVRDSLLEVSNLFVGRAKGTPLASHGKQISRVQEEVLGAMSSAYEPLLERHVGKRIVLDVAIGDGVVEHCGILKDYTTEFIEILDADFSPKKDAPPRKADLIMPRKFAIARHLGE